MRVSEIACWQWGICCCAAGLPVKWCWTVCVCVCLQPSEDEREHCDVDIIESVLRCCHPAHAKVRHVSIMYDTRTADIASLTPSLTVHQL